jgi:hypothetical protein
LCEGFNCRVIGDVSRHGNCSTTCGANFGGNAFNFIDSSCRTDNCGPGLGQSLGDSFANAAAGSGDDGDVIGKIK